MVELTCQVIPDEFTDYLASSFDYEFDGTSKFTLPDFTTPENFKIGLIVGSSGSGKSQILKNYFNFNEEGHEWQPDKAIVSHFNNPEEAVKKLMACGLSSIPSMTKPYRVLSNGERFRADVARQLSDGAIIDEYTSVVNREVAKSLSIALHNYVHTEGLQNIVLASCHRDIIDWLKPDWIFDTDSMDLAEMDVTHRRRVARIEIEY
jgi:hypothetical protein